MSGGAPAPVMSALQALGRQSALRPFTPLREELTLHPAPRDHHHAPTWSLHDPACNRFFRIGWLEFEILCRWGMGQPEAVAEAINRETPLATTPQQVDRFHQFLLRHNLVRPVGPEGLARLLQQAKAAHRHWATVALHSYLFFRIPLVRPDRFLARTLPWIAWVYTRGFLLAVILAGLLGLHLVIRQWEGFMTTLPHLFTWEGALLSFLSLFLVKAAHELGHAYTAKRFGCRVPTMGVAFLVLWPMLYTETSEAWKLPARRQRLAVVAAGVAAELTLAVFATLAWSFLPDGPLRAALFFVASVSWIMSLAFNLNPFMRFDGYYLLSDWLEIQNLHSRAFAMGRWWLREALLGLGHPPPESTTTGRRWLFIAIACATWIYRFFLFLGIALLVYHLFFKVLGLFLMGVEITWFIALPVYSELAAWVHLRRHITLNPRSATTLAALLFTLLLLLVPWHGQVEAPALLERRDHTVLFAPAPARVAELLVAAGQRVEAGQPLVRLASPDLEWELRQSAMTIAQLTWQLSHQGMDATLLDRSRVTREELQAQRTKHRGQLAMRDKLTVTAPFAGEVVEVAEHLKAGDWVAQDEPLVDLADHQAWVAEGYLAERDLNRVAVGAGCRFYPENPDWSPLPCRVAAVDPVNTRRLTEPYLASVYDGPLPVRVDGPQRNLTPDHAVYRVQLALGNPVTPPLRQALRGSVVIQARAEGLLAGWGRQALAVLVRESGF